MRSASFAHKIRRKIKRAGVDKLWTYSDFSSMPVNAVAATLSRLAKGGMIERVRKGIYYVPKHTRFGTTSADPVEIAKAVFENRGIKWRLSGLPMFNKLGLTTQISGVLSFDIDKDTRSVRIGDKHRIRVAGGRRVEDMSSEERAVLDALRRIKSIPDTTPTRSISKIVDIFKSDRLDYGRLTKFAKYEPPRVRALVGMIGTMLGRSTEELAALRGTLNPSTTYKLEISEMLPEAKRWNIT